MIEFATDRQIWGPFDRKPVTLNSSMAQNNPYLALFPSSFERWLCAFFLFLRGLFWQLRLAETMFVGAVKLEGGWIMALVWRGAARTNARYWPTSKGLFPICPKRLHQDGKVRRALWGLFQGRQGIKVAVKWKCNYLAIVYNLGPVTFIFYVCLHLAELPGGLVIK